MTQARLWPLMDKALLWSKTNCSPPDFRRAIGWLTWFPEQWPIIKNIKISKWRPNLARAVVAEWPHCSTGASPQPKGSSTIWQNRSMKTWMKPEWNDKTITVTAKAPSGRGVRQSRGPCVVLDWHKCLASRICNHIKDSFGATGSNMFQQVSQLIHLVIAVITISWVNHPTVKSLAATANGWGVEPGQWRCTSSRDTLANVGRLITWCGLWGCTCIFSSSS